jgi:hypothetical protein
VKQCEDGALVLFVMHPALPCRKQRIYPATGKCGGVPNDRVGGQVKTLRDCMESYPFESCQDCHCPLPVTQAAVSQPLRKAAGFASVRNIDCYSRKWIIFYENLPYPGRCVRIFRSDSSVLFQNFVTVLGEIRTPACPKMTESFRAPQPLCARSARTNSITSGVTLLGLLCGPRLYP